MADALHTALDSMDHTPITSGVHSIGGAMRAPAASLFDDERAPASAYSIIVPTENVSVDVASPPSRPRYPSSSSYSIVVASDGSDPAHEGEG